MFRTLSFGFVFLATASLAPAQSNTFVVDDNGGPGVHFTDLPAAINASSPGDLLVVRAGNYSGFVLDKGLNIVGFGVVQTGNVRVQSIPAGAFAVLAGLHVRQLDVVQNAGAVLFDEISASDNPTTMALASDYVLVTVEHCADVRFHRADLIAPGMTGNFGGPTGLFVRGSRVELSSSRVHGGRGGNPPSSGCWSGNPGGRGLFVVDASRVHIALSTLRGGDGTDGDALCVAEGGDGGDALRIDGQSSVVVAGEPDDVLRGGARGLPHFQIADPGRAAYVVNGDLRYSGCTLASGGNNYPAIAGPATLAVPADPVLRFSGDATPGAVLLFGTLGTPAFNMRLQQGNTPLVVDDGLTDIERLSNRIRLHPLGPIPATGESLYPMQIPGGVPTGWLRVLQGYEIDTASGQLVARTNSVIVVAR